MVQQCPNCLILVGKLHMRCICCGIYFCEDCVDPHKHYCPSYCESMKDITCHTHRITNSTEKYKGFASFEDLEEPVQEISLKEKEKQNKEHIVKANLIFQERLRLGIAKLPDGCPNCKSTMNKVNEKCTLCGIKFCIYCVKPDKHKCVIDEYEKEKHSPLAESYGTIIELPVTSFILEKQPLIMPETTTKPTANIETMNKPEVQANPVENSKEKEEQKEIRIKKKISLWRKFLSLFGFSN